MASFRDSDSGSAVDSSRRTLPDIGPSGSAAGVERDCALAAPALRSSASTMSVPYRNQLRDKAASTP
jgi:hypothetical protein